MAEPFIGEIKMFGFKWAPKDWALCDGTLLPVNQNQALYSLLGTNYGGDGRTSFGLPEMRGRTPVHIGTSQLGQTVNLGQFGGFEKVPLNLNQMGAHTHTMQASTDAGETKSLSGTVLAESTNNGAPGGNVYGAAAGLTALDAGSVSNTGGGQPHDNMQPSLVVSFCIALKGLYPSRN